MDIDVKRSSPIYFSCLIKTQFIEDHWGRSAPTIHSQRFRLAMMIQQSIPIPSSALSSSSSSPLVSSQQQPCCIIPPLGKRRKPAPAPAPVPELPQVPVISPMPFMSLLSPKISQTIATTAAEAPLTVVKDEHPATSLLLDTSDTTIMIDTLRYHSVTTNHQLCPRYPNTWFIPRSPSYDASSRPPTSRKPSPSLSSYLPPSSPIPMVGTFDSLQALHPTFDTPLADPSICSAY